MSIVCICPAHERRTDQAHPVPPDAFRTRCFVAPTPLRLILAAEISGFWLIIKVKPHISHLFWVLAHYGS